MQTNICQSCGISFIVGPACKGIYCSKPCAREGLKQLNAEKNAVKHEKTILEYNANPKKCKNCDVEMPWEKRRGKFCSKSCSAKYNNIRRDPSIKTGPSRMVNPDHFYCKVCNTEIKKKRKFCSPECKSIGMEALYSAKRGGLPPPEKPYVRYMRRLRQQTPKWADKKVIRNFYKNRPPGYEVDHIIPISKGGLHVIENLQYLPKHENRSKGSKFPDL